MKKRLGVVMDPIASINFAKDTSLAMLVAAKVRGMDLFYMEVSDLFIESGKAYAMLHKLDVFMDDNHWFELGEPKKTLLSDLDVILMRKDPPFDNEFIYATYILEAAERDGTLVVNKPASLRDCNEKIFATQFPECSPTHLVAKDMGLLKAFHQAHKDVIFKPLDGMGGSRIFRVKEDDPNLSVILETLTEFGAQSIMAQVYIPDIVKGDKRLHIVNYEPMPYALARIPAKGETRGNLAAGATSEVVKASKRDLWICEQVIPVLKEKGLLFVGLDIIGDYLTEINVTSPTCVREIYRETELDIAGKLMDAILTI
ncbi:MAG: glutathione synthase [Cellvibrionales bacterium]|nr:glutathione synthase [Cellvibrionales bacterium]